ncbi:GDP/GTP exchange factor for ARF [Pleurotus ostreatus]|nr:GDP/GTP exchange factor for ARF [Pleurotus ostreatus]
MTRSVSTKHVLHSEILSVTSTMRKNSRWASTAHFMSSRDSALGTNLGLRISSPSHPVQPTRTTSREGDLMAGFQELKRTISEVESIDTIPLPTLLAPFFAIIRSPLSTGPITSSALHSLHHFFVCGLISPDAVSLDTALVELSSAVSHCKFEASDSSGDEVVLLRIMTVIHDCLCGSVGQLLGDVEVCEMLETVLTTCCQMRLSEILRRCAENTMHGLVKAVFSRLTTLDPIAEEEKLRESEEEAGEGEIRMNVSTKDALTDELPEAESAPDADTDVPPSVEKERAATPQPEPEPEPLRTPTSSPRPAYGLPSILELLRVLINVLDPHDQQHTDSTRLVALGALNIAFEESGSALILFPSLEALVVDSGCKYMFQLARSDNPHVLQAALRTVATVFETMRPRLKLQLELFLAFTIDRLAPAPATNKAQTALSISKKSGIPNSPHPSTPTLGGSLEPESGEGAATPTRVLVAPARGETRDQILETLSQLARKPGFMVDLYTNYDCDVNCENMFERLIEFLTKSVYSSQYAGGAIDVRQRNAQYLCLDLLLAFVNDMAVRADGSATWPKEYPEPSALMETKSRKQLVLTGAARFNAKPKTGLAFLEEHGLIYADLGPETTKAQSLARFLKGCGRIDKRLLGDFISKPDNVDVLHAFISLFDFKGKHIADAMREMLESFRLPGEAQQIARITETFASIYFAAKPEGIQSEDAVYVLAYSVIMLNTDLHNPQVLKRMSIEDYTRNLRGVNNGANFAPEYLQNIYDSIRKREIVMPEEHTGQLGFEYAWKELLARSRQSGELLMCNSALFDVNMFKSVWKPVISAIAYAFISFDDDYIIQRAIAGFRQCATLAGRFNLPDVFDFVVVSLSQATSLLSESLPAQVPNYPVVEVEGQAITVSSLSVKFGTNFKGQLAVVVLFNIVNGNGNALREGWTQIFEMFQNLFLHSLLPTRMLQMEDFLGGVSMIPLRGSQPARQQQRNDGGLLSALSSYLMTPYGPSDHQVPDATDSDIENTLCTIDCITSCRLDELYSQIMQLDLEALVAAVRSLEALAHERTVARFKQESDDGAIAVDGDAYALPYDPASVFLLETMVSILCQTPDRIDELWPIVFEHLSALLSSANHYSVLLIERAVVALLRLCLILATKPALRDQVYVSFDLLSGLHAHAANSVAEQVVSGVVLVIQKHPDIVRSQTEWNLIFALLRSTMSNPEASRLSFEFISSLASDGPHQVVTPDNFAGLVMILDDFATAAGKAIENQQTRGRQKQQLTSAQSPVIDRGCKAVDSMFDLKKFMTVFIKTDIPQAQVWRQHCLPLLSSLSRQSANAAREVRYSALSQLQRLLLGPHLVLEKADAAQVEEIFNRVLFPLLDDLVKPQVNQRDPQGMPESRLRASAFLCKAFMHFEVRESQANTDIRIVWIQVLDLLDRLMNVDKGDHLNEAVPESLKNVLLVMNAASLLIPPPPGEDYRTERQRTVWTSTHERMERFLPGFLAEIIPSSREAASA